ncbi:uncharacterized protein DFL_002715 [Arthrobotrys flagrans]|uniref:Uncharacterized protein n=1 Tax=Arthrobotrys flagrans TaxID=97331 RepID=A0A437AB94_ARTFL|nr:hypothetical protein DFL_002715 [Arthrobotrys flagrans]
MRLSLCLIPLAALVSSTFATPGPEVTPLADLKKRGFAGPGGCPSTYISAISTLIPSQILKCTGTKAVSITLDCGLKNGCTKMKLFTVQGTRGAALSGKPLPHPTTTYRNCVSSTTKYFCKGNPTPVN